MNDRKGYCMHTRIHLYYLIPTSCSEICTHNIHHFQERLFLLMLRTTDVATAPPSTIATFTVSTRSSSDATENF